MLSIVLICLGLVADDGHEPPAKAPPTAPPTRRRRKAAGQDAAAQRPAGAVVRAARDDRRADGASGGGRDVHDPSNGAARGLTGVGCRGGKGERPEEVSREARDDPRAEGPAGGISPAPGQDSRQGRRPVAAGPVVRTERAEGTGRRALPRGVAAGPEARRGVEAPGDSRRSTGAGSSPSGRRQRSGRPANRPGPTSAGSRCWRSGVRGYPAGSRRGGKKLRSAWPGVTDPAPCRWSGRSSWRGEPRDRGSPCGCCARSTPPVRPGRSP